MRVVVTTPVAKPACFASVNALATGCVRPPSQSPRSGIWPTARKPMRVFTPVIMAVMVPAESGVWLSVL